ncbi:MAG: ROK family protein [Flavobacteriales bacterium]|nr:ROK family protein [Flavobacteriales bacterium]
MILKHDNKEEAIVGVFLGGKVLYAGKVKNDRIVKSTSYTIDNLASEEEVLDQVIKAIKEVFDDEVKGIGIGVPSLVDTENGIVYEVQHIPSWEEVHLKDILTDIFNVSIYVNNDANCFVVGEKYFGKAITKKNAVGLVIGTGLGAGIIVDNKLYSGINCGAGEIGMMPYKEHNIEYYVSSKSFLDKYEIDFQSLLERAKEGNKIALRIFEQFGEDIAMAIQITLFAYAPEIIILGGPTAIAYDFFKVSMMKELEKFPYKKVVENIEIEVSMNIEMPVLGAAALLLDAKQKKFILN